jgi:DNA polymerase-3 subunit delta'
LSNIPRQRFIESAKTKRILAAYLIVCKRNEVAAALCDDFLMQLYCHQGGCGFCADCKKVMSGHIDILRLSEPKVDEIRDAIDFVSQKAVDGVYKAIVIEKADDMNSSAANSLLKTLESPPKDSVILLCARSVSGVLPTIASRCAILHLAPDEDFAEKVAAALGVDEVTVRVLADLSGGFAEEAVRIYNDEAFMKLRSEAIEHCHRFIDQKGNAISAFADFFESCKESMLPVLGVVQSYLHDISIQQKTQNSTLIANLDYKEQIISSASHFTSGAISNMIRVILEAERRFFFAVNFRLAVEKMLFDILEERNRWKK